MKEPQVALKHRQPSMGDNEQTGHSHVCVQRDLTWGPLWSAPTSSLGWKHTVTYSAHVSGNLNSGAAPPPLVPWP